VVDAARRRLSLRESRPQRSHCQAGVDRAANRIVADALIQGDERAVYADKAYDSQTRREALAEAGIVLP
jgi:hypothetical protein